MQYTQNHICQRAGCTRKTMDRLCTEHQQTLEKKWEAARASLKDLEKKPGELNDLCRMIQGRKSWLDIIGRTDGGHAL